MGVSSRYIYISIIYYLPRFVPAEHVWGYWTTVKRKANLRALTNCVAERTYAAVGWGGTDWVDTRYQ